MIVAHKELKYLLCYYNSCCITPLEVSGPELESCFHKTMLQSSAEESPSIAPTCLQGDVAVLIWYNPTKPTQFLPCFWSDSLGITSHN